MLRFSLLTLAAFVTAIAVACAAMINASPLISSLAWTLTVLALAFASVAAVLASQRRGFWTGFAIVGWVFTFVTVSPLLGHLQQTSLFTTALLERAASAMPQAQGIGGLPAAPVYTPITMYAKPTPTAPVTVVAPASPNVPGYRPPPPPISSAPAIASYPVTTYAPYDVAPAAAQFRESFVRIGQALWVLVLALAGGLLGQYLMVRNERALA